MQRYSSPSSWDHLDPRILLSYHFLALFLNVYPFISTRFGKSSIPRLRELSITARGGQEAGWGTPKAVVVREVA